MAKCIAFVTGEVLLCGSIYHLLKLELLASGDISGKGLPSTTPPFHTTNAAKETRNAM